MPFGIENSSMEKTGVKPHILTGVFLQVCRAIFSDPESISEEGLKRYIWHPDSKISRIQIESMYRWKTEDVQARPAVIVKRGAWRIEKQGIGDNTLGGTPLTGYDEAEHLTGIAGTHSIFCLGTTGLEAELVGTEVYQAFLGFSKLIREQFCLGQFNVSEIGTVSRFEESHVHFVVPVTLAYRFFVRWELLRQTPEWMRTSFGIDRT
jgi:hypothetical protein